MIINQSIFISRYTNPVITIQINKFFKLLVIKHLRTFDLNYTLTRTLYQHHMCFLKQQIIQNFIFDCFEFLVTSHLYFLQLVVFCHLYILSNILKKFFFSLIIFSHIRLFAIINNSHTYTTWSAGQKVFMVQPNKTKLINKFATTKSLTFQLEFTFLLPIFTISILTIDHTFQPFLQLLFLLLSKLMHHLIINLFLFLNHPFPHFFLYLAIFQLLLN